MYNREKFKSAFEILLKLEYAKNIETASLEEKYFILAKTMMNSIVDDWTKTDEKYQSEKRAYYFSLEYLMGRNLGNNMINLGYFDEMCDFIREDLHELCTEIEEVERDAGLGNGGLGRLASCFLESAATCNLPLYGYGLRYSEGIFKQSFVEGFQLESGDNWLQTGDPWSIRKDSEEVLIEMGKEMVRAVPYDYPILGYETKNVNTLRLWQAEAIEEFDFQKFNNFEYDEAVREKNSAENITRVLYPNDSKREGKVLRFKQQYFFVSASLQDMVRRHLQQGRNLINFADYHSIQLNDTHPVIGICELMRILVDLHQLDFDMALGIVKKTFNYTNHTILKEALEQWPEDIVREVCPRTFEYIYFLDHRFVQELQREGYTQDAIENMRFERDGKVRMAYLGIYGSKKVNGVAEIHTNILKNKELKDWSLKYPEKFINKTNGVTPRRWLQLSNPELSLFIDERIGEEWKFDLTKLKELEKFSEDTRTLEELNSIKLIKKQQLARVIEQEQGIIIDPTSIFDIQVKRIHEYKRQLLNGLHIYHLYALLKEQPNLDIYPRTFIFAGKAAPGYARAKGIIKYINELSRVINNDSKVNDRLKVIFLENYRVSLGEKIFPAADISEQISTAGKEASGTGNMKFMINATPTLGTLDGANVEIVQEAGIENNYIFGATVEELEVLSNSYNPNDLYQSDPILRRAVDSLMGHVLSDNNTFMFLDLYQSLLKQGYPNGDEYYILQDFNSYRETQEKINQDFRKREEWAKKCLFNLARSGKFSSDRTIQEYAKEIWEIKENRVQL